MANDEDFGMVKAEAQSCGTPVIAYAKGGALEIVVDTLSEKRTRMSEEVRLPTGRKSDFLPIPTGVLFNDQTPESLAEAIKKCGTMTFDRAAISRSAERFSEKRFHELFTNIIKSVY